MANPGRPVVNFTGIDHEVNLLVVRLALVRRQVAGEFRSREELARAAGCGRCTVIGFLAGRQTTLPNAMALLDKLHLTFEEVFTPVGVDVP